MQKLALFFTALLVATLSFANNATPTKTQRAIANSWRSSNNDGVSMNHDVNMVYGGEDVTLHHDFSHVNATA